MIDTSRPRAIALGYFDGVHLGHRALMERAVQRAREIDGIASVFTFDTHPNAAMTGRPVPLLTAAEYRAEEIKLLGGVDEVIFGQFERLRTVDWRDFIHEILVGEFGARYIVTGFNNRFGYQGRGTPEGLAEECRKLGIGCDRIEEIRIDGVTVSSTYIRGLIAEGNMERAMAFLGHPYTITGHVEHGRSVGHKMGIPTVNLPLPREMALPPYGVYAARVLFDGRAFPAATNIGEKPTFVDGGAPTIEPHLLDFDGDLYGKRIHVELHKFLRPERAFASVEALKEAIALNIRQTRDYFSPVQEKR